MDAQGFFVVVGLFILLMLVFKYSDRWIKKMSRETAKLINWAGFTVAVFSGIAWYLLGDDIFMFITFAGIITYFVFYGYDKLETKEQRQDNLG